MDGNSYRSVQFDFVGKPGHTDAIWGWCAPDSVRKGRHSIFISQTYLDWLLPISSKCLDAATAIVEVLKMPGDSERKGSMNTTYYAYLKDSTLPTLNNCVDMAVFPSDDPEAAQLIAQARFAEELKDPNTFIDMDVYGVPLAIVLDEGDDGE
jgi:hypothetical protein